LDGLALGRRDAEGRAVVGIGVGCGVG